MVGILILNLVSTPLVLLSPVPLKIVVDNVFGEEPFPKVLTRFLPDNFDYSFTSILLIAVSLVIIISILKNIQSLLLWILQSYAGERLVLSFRSRLFSHIQKMIVSGFQILFIEYNMMQQQYGIWY